MRIMAALDFDPAEVEAWAHQARARIEESLVYSEGDGAAFWHAVSLIYQRGLPTHAPDAVPGSLDAIEIVDATARPLTHNPARL